MSFKPSSILVFGATGNIGQHITRSILSAQPAFDKVTIFTSQATTASKAKASLLGSWTSSAAGRLNVIIGDVNSEVDVTAALQGIDTVVSCVGRGALMIQTQLVSLAQTAGVKWFFPSEYGTDIEYYGPDGAGEKPHQMKLAVRKFIRDNVDINLMQVTYLVTGPYIDMYLDFVPGARVAGGWDPKRKESVLLGDGEGKVGFCTMRDVGKLLVASLHHPEASLGKALKVQSFVVSPREIQSEFEKQTGGTGWSVSYTPLDELKTLESKAWKEGNPVATLYTLRRIWAQGGTLYNQTDNEAIGLSPCDMDTLEWAVAQAVSRR